MNIHHRNETLVGVGDAQLFLHYATSLGSIRLGSRFGLNLPTGIVHDNPFTLGNLGLPHEHIQFGTGTFDPVVALDLAKNLGSWSLALFAYGHIPLYQGPKGYRAGARVLGGVVASSGLGFTGPVFRLGMSALHEFAERWDGRVPTEDGNQGRTDLYLGPGVTIPFSQDWTVSFDLRARIYGHSVNAQLNLPLVVEVSLGRLFHLESGRHEEVETTLSASNGDVLDIVQHGEAIRLDPVPGKWTVFDFWASWCEACKTLDAELTKMAAANDNIAIRRVNIVDFESPISLQELRGVTALPYVRLIGPLGNLAWQGSTSPDEVLEQLRRHVAVPLGR